ncbi:glycosyltransferase [Suttonella sp. R2A3]|nr:glycosyltransferase [Suttonella sp. R2A3]UJF23810.1 glycosyltransferase [Suttonella sp. R2A3]
MVGGEEKNRLIRQSQALLFPVRWHEPFGLAIIESLYLGCPVIATPYGALPEIVSNERIGRLSCQYDELAEAVRAVDQFDRRACHEHAKKYFNHLTMTDGYQQCYEKVIAGEKLNNEPPFSRAKPNNKTGLLPVTI